jgi:uncharacterized OB-fold protein
MSDARSVQQADEPGWNEYGNWAEGKPLMAGPWFLGTYQPSPEAAEYWRAVARGELLVKRCEECGRLDHPRRIVCARCGSEKLGWQPASGAGTVYSFSEIHRATSPVAGPVPYTVGVVRLEEGVYLMTRLNGSDRHPVAVDAPVRVEFRRLEAGYTLPVFVVTGPAQARGRST